MKVRDLQRALEVFAKYAPAVFVEADEQAQLHVFAGDGQTDEASALAGMVQYDLDRLDRLAWHPATGDQARAGELPGSHWVAST